MKKIFTLLFLASLANLNGLHAQAKLTITSFTIPRNFTIGETVQVGFTVKNNGTVICNDSIRIFYHTLSDTTPGIITTILDTLPVGKSFTDTEISFVIDPAHFPSKDTSKNIIVVWPTGLELNGNIDPAVKYEIDSTPVVYKDSSVTTSILSAGGKVDNRIKIYPNPSKDAFFMEFRPTGLAVKSIQISDITGKSMDGWSFSDNRVNFENMPSGIYLVSITLSDNTITRFKIIRQ